MKKILGILILYLVSSKLYALPLLEGEYVATGYSAPGQSKYAAFTAAKVDAQRQLLEQINQTQVETAHSLEDGKAKVKTVVSGILKNAQIVKKEYDNATKTAIVTIKVNVKKEK